MRSIASPVAAAKQRQRVLMEVGRRGEKRPSGLVHVDNVASGTYAR